MNKKLLGLVALTTVGAIHGNALAQPFSSFDPRSMGMGGAGVAVARPDTASFFNPALLSTPRQDDDFALNIPYVGARFRDPDSLVDHIDTTQTAIDKLDATIAFVEANPTNASNFSNLVTDFSAVNTELQGVSDKPISGEVGAGIAGGIPGPTLGIGAFVEGRAIISGKANYSTADQTLVDGLISDAEILDVCVTTPTDCSISGVLDLNTITVDDINNPTSIDVNFDSTQNLNSAVDARGIAAYEAGISFSHAFSQFALGITPKYVSVETFDYRATVNSADTGNVDSSDYTKKYTDYNFDVGMAKAYGDHTHVGLVIKNILPKEYDTVRKDQADYAQRGGAIKLSPQVRAGAAYELSWMTLAADLDITKNKGLGFVGKESQYLSLGAELDAFRVLQFRVGYRADLVDNDASVITAGVGLSLFGTHLDIAAAGNDNEIGGALQFGIAF